MCEECNNWLAIINEELRRNHSEDHNDALSFFALKVRPTCPDAAKQALEKRDPKLTKYEHIHRLLALTSETEIKKNKPRIEANLKANREQMETIIRRIEAGTFDPEELQ